MMTEPLVKLADLIGELPEVRCDKGIVSVRGLEIAYWSFAIHGAHKAPVISIHGGPAFTHNYILPLKLLATYGFPVILYDQAGCGASTNGVGDPSESHPHLLTIEYYVAELGALIEHLRLATYYVYGSSWGTVVAQEFAVRQPKGLLGLVLDGALSDGPTYIKTQWRDRISKLPTFTQKLLRKLEDEQDYDSPLYKEICDVLTHHFTTRLVPYPDCFTDCFLPGYLNEAIYCKMQGKSEFTLGGVLEKWRIVERHANIAVPALVMIGEFDTMTEECGQQGRTQSHAPCRCSSFHALGTASYLMSRKSAARLWQVSSTIVWEQAQVKCVLK